MEISVSYAVIYMDAKSGKFLIVHPTHETYWSLPKGGMEEADCGDGAKAAARELFEETAIKAAPAALKYGGRHDYYRAGRNGKTKNKDLCIYLYETDEAMQPSEMTCASMVHSGRALPRKRRFQIHRIRRNRRILPRRRRKSAESGDEGAGDWRIAAKTGCSKTRRYARSASAPYRRAR